MLSAFDRAMARLLEIYSTMNPPTAAQLATMERIACWCVARGEFGA